MSYICKKEFNVEIVDDDGFGTDKYRIVKIGEKYKASNSAYRLVGGADTIRLEGKNGRWMELLPDTISEHFDKRLEIDDFVAGEKAYVVSKGEIHEVQVYKVGRKYVFVKGYCEFFLRHEEDNYLVENKDWGEKESLYLSKKEAEDELEYSSLLRRIEKATKYYELRTLKLDQLRRIWNIINEGKG